jgi:hypothetical protein
MKLIARGDTNLILSAHMLHPATKDGSYVKLIINTLDKWPQWRDCGTSPQYLQDYPNQLGAFAIEGKKQDAVLLVVPETALDTHLLKNSMRYSCLEKDQLSIVWLSYIYVNVPTTILATLYPQPS